jgi:hypothetical protein
MGLNMRKQREVLLLPFLLFSIKGKINENRLPWSALVFDKKIKDIETYKYSNKQIH